MLLLFFPSWRVRIRIKHKHKGRCIQLWDSSSRDGDQKEANGRHVCWGAKPAQMGEESLPRTGGTSDRLFDGESNEGSVPGSEKNVGSGNRRANGVGDALHTGLAQY